jgi:hypothetical protein
VNTVHNTTINFAPTYEYIPAAIIMKQCDRPVCVGTTFVIVDPYMQLIKISIIIGCKKKKRSLGSSSTVECNCSPSYLKKNHFSAFSIHFNVTYSDCPQIDVNGWGKRRFRAPMA